MRAIVLAFFALLSPFTAAQPILKATQLAEFADGLSQPHDAAFSPDGKLIYLTDMRNSRMRVLEAMTLKLVGTFGARELSNPHDAVFDKAGRLLDFKHRATFGAALKLNGPKYLAFDGDRIWLADENNHRIALLDRAHQPLGMLGTGKRGRAAGEFNKPEAVLARAPYVWVIDTYNDRVLLLRVE